MLPEFQSDILGGQMLRQVLDGATQLFLAFTLVVTRLSGMMVTGPVFGHPDIPLQLRVLLVFALSFTMVPTLVGADPARVFSRLDQNHDARLTRIEVPPSLHPQFDAFLERAGLPENAALSESEFLPGLPLPNSPLDFLWLALVEFALGTALGLGVMTVLAGLQMAGSLIDQQIGVSLGEVFNPELEINATLSGQLLHQLGLIVFLVVGGHYLMVSSLLDTFQALPVGYAHVSQPVFDLLRELVHQSLTLAVQVSAPVMATMAVVGMAMGFLGHTIPQINVLIVGAPVRTLVGLIVLGLALPGIADVMTHSLTGVVDQLRQILTGN